MNQSKQMQDIVMKVDNELLRWLAVKKEGGIMGNVCCICDRFVQPSNVSYVSKVYLEKNIDLIEKNREIPVKVQEHYKYLGEGSSEKIEMGMLSPKTVVTYDKRKKDYKFLLCNRCKYSLVTKKEAPVYAINNGFELGKCPPELEDLSDIELAFISPIKCYNHLLTFKGGHKGIKGFHSVLKSDVRKTRRFMEQLDRLEDFKNEIYIVFHGHMTVKQKKYLKLRNTIRRDKCKIALDWLLHNNSLFKEEFGDWNLDEIPDPILIDETEDVDSANNNVEMKTEVKFVFPDGTFSEMNGGMESSSEYKAVVSEILNRSTLAQVEEPFNDFANDYEGENFVKLFPKLFPYGFGGPKESRVRKNGTRGKLCTKDYIQHIVNLSNIYCHEPLVTLVGFNMIQKESLLRKGYLQITRNRSDCHGIESVVPEDILEEIERRNNGYSCLDTQGRRFLQALDVMTSILPHGNEAAKKGRTKALALHVKYGIPDIFFTLSPSDDNSPIIVVYGEKTPVLTGEWSSLEAVNKRVTERSNIRFRLPGLSTLNFEAILKVVLNEVVGWNKEDGGIFGVPKTYFYAVEEQSRGNLHVHMLLWVKDLPFEREKMLRTNLSKREEKRVDAAVAQYLNSIQSNSLLKSGRYMDVNLKCCKKSKNGRYIERVSDQRLRNLRHKEGCYAEKCAIYECRACGYKWSSDDFANDYAIELLKQDTPRLKVLEKKEDFSNLSRKKLSQCRRTLLNEVVFESKLPGRKKPKNLHVAVSALYNVHSTAHVPTCFKEGRHECRYKFPKLPVKRTFVKDKGEEDWYTYTGQVRKRRIIEIIGKRDIYDMSTNSFSPVIASSTISCNSNVQLIADGVQAFYVTKYSSKDTQKDDKSSYEDLISYVQRRLISRKFESPTSESLSRIIGASLLHGSRNVISATMAKYLINNESRFSCSENMVFLPIFQMKQLLRDKKLIYRLQCSEVTNRKQNLCKVQYVTSDAINYIFRPRGLERTCFHDFVEQYYIGKNPEYGETDPNNVSKDGWFNMSDGHPFRNLRALHERKKSVFVGINNWEFKDTHAFEGNLLEGHITEEMEEYAFTVLICFHWYRSLEELQTNGSFVEKFRMLHEVWGQKEKYLLQNIQDIRNSVRCYRTREDELDLITEPFKGVENDADGEGEEEEQQQQAQDMHREHLWNSLMSIDNEVQTMKETDVQLGRNMVPNSDAEFSTIEIPQWFDFGYIRNEGKYRCGYQCLTTYSQEWTEEENFVEVDNNTTSVEGNKRDRDTEIKDVFDRQYSSKERLYQVMVSSVKRVVSVERESDEDSDATGDKNVQYRSKDFIIATGTKQSIFEWAREKKFDKEQRLAFSIITSHFIMGIVTDCENQDLNSTNHESENNERKITSLLRREFSKLKTLGGNRDVLRMFLDGAGGSGKSEVLKEVLKYCQEFSENIGLPFTKDTILVTASTGVAATLINGTTVHTGIKLFQRVNSSHIEWFKQVRMIIIDEISMVDVATLTQIENRIKDLREERNEPYGGLPVVFVGDFRQLEPVGKKQSALFYDLNSPSWYHALNMYVETKGLYRFKEDITWGLILRRLRNGCPTKDDFEVINSHVVNKSTNKTISGDPLPENLSYVTFTNKERDAINAGIFHQVVKNAPDKCILILSDKVGAKLHKKDAFQEVKNLSSFWYCGESDCKFYGRTTSRIDPTLKIFQGCPVMFTDNMDVEHCIANGTEGIVQKVVLKSCPVFRKIEGNDVKVVLASQVKHVEIFLTKHNRTVKVEPKKFTSFTTQFCVSEVVDLPKKTLLMTAVQIPVVVSCATTCHKLQGGTKQNLMINSFNYQSNWAYVALSRVKTLKGLFLRRPLDITKDYSVNEHLSTMNELLINQKGINSSRFWK